MYVVFEIETKDEVESMASSSSEEEEELDVRDEGVEKLESTENYKEKSPKNSKPASTNKVARKYRLMRKKLASVFLTEKVPIQSDIFFWKKLSDDFQTKIVKKTLLSSLVFLKTMNAEAEGSAVNIQNFLDEIQLEPCATQFETLEKTHGHVYKLCDQKITSIFWINEKSVMAAAANEHLFIVPENAKINVSIWGGVEKLCGSPKFPGLFAALCGDEQIRICQLKGNSLQHLKTITSYKCAPRAIQFTTTDHRFLIVGYHDGYLIVWDWEAEAMVQMIQVSSRPICSLTKSVHDDRHIFVGSMDPRLYEVDIRSGRCSVLTSQLASIPTVAYSEFDGVLYADNEHHCRYLDRQDKDDIRPRPLGTFDSTVWSLAGSPFHNVVASCSANGTVHLSWISSAEARLIIEKKILSYNESGFNDTPVVVQIPAKDHSKLYEPSIGLSCVTWCPCIDTPGLLAVSSLSGHLLLLPCDRNILY